MYRGLPHRLTTFAVLACFLAANTFNALWHNHAHHEHADDEAAGVACHHADHEHEVVASGQWPVARARAAISSPATSHQPPATSCEHADHDVDALAAAGEHHQAALHDDDCAACRFVGQRGLSVATTESDRCGLLAERLAVASAGIPSDAFRLAAQPRAPPLPG
jgi:hypothetical protein